MLARDKIERSLYHGDIQRAMLPIASAGGPYTAIALTVTAIAHPAALIAPYRLLYLQYVVQ